MADPMRDFARPVTEELRRLVVVSPHFDDAVLGCGQLLSAHAGATVVTVLGGRPELYPEVVTDWDASGGFATGDDVVAARREEDRNALAVLDATSVWLEFSDHQYVPPDARYHTDDVAPALEAALVELDPTAVFFPFGLGNPERTGAHRPARRARARAVPAPAAATGGLGGESPGPDRGPLGEVVGGERDELLVGGIVELHQA